MGNILTAVELAQVIFQDFKIDFEGCGDLIIFKIEFLQHKNELVCAKSEIGKLETDEIYCVVLNFMLKLLKEG